MTAQPPDDSEAIFEAETARFREILAKGRSATQLALFDLLVERSRDPRSPKEIEVALALFGSVATHDAGSDSGVRVYVHRLRKRIDEYYLARTGPRLVIPKGEYRIALERSDRPAQPPSGSDRCERRMGAAESERAECARDRGILGRWVSRGRHRGGDRGVRPTDLSAVGARRRRWFESEHR